MKKLALSLVWVLAITDPATNLASRDKPPFSLVLAAPDEPLKAGAELHLRVTVTNTSNRKIAFIRSPGLTPEEGFRYQIEVRDAQGQLASPSAYVQNLKKSVNVNEEISRYAEWRKHGEFFVDDLNITKFYDLRKPGTYVITVTRPMPPRQNLGRGVVKSNTIEVTLIP